MTTLREALARLGSFFRKQELDREFDEELTTHVELAIRDNVRQGMNPAEARRRALIRLGGVEPARDRHRQSRGLPWLDDIVRDVGYALRGLRRNPGFTVTAIVTMAIGIGVNATIFTVTNAVLFKGFPLVVRNDRLVYISDGGCCISYPDFEDYRAQSKSFQGMAIVHGTGIILSDGTGLPESVQATEASADTFRLVGAHPLRGRDFEPADEVDGAGRVTILSYGYWQRRYALDPAIVGRAVRLNGAAATVIGVMPRGFSFPQKVDIWVPLVRTPHVQNRENRDTWFAFGRLRDDATFAAARTEIESIAKRISLAYPLTNQYFHPVVQHFHEFFIGPKATLIYGSMWGAVGFVLLIACANLANLLLARALGRSREIWVRVALGAGRWRIVRQLLIESVMLSGLGGFCGWWLAKWGLRSYELAMAYKASWLIVDYSMDSRVVTYFVVVSIGTGILFGLAPALRLAKLDVNAGLKDGSRGATAGGRGRHLSAVLVTAEMALSVVLLAGAGVMIRSFLKIHSADMGVSIDKILTASVDLPEGRYDTPEKRLSFYEGLQARLQANPEIESVAFADALPSNSALRRGYEIAGLAPVLVQNNGQPHPALSVLTVTPNYFRTLGASLRSGREFSAADTAAAVPVVLVNQRLAEMYWPREQAVGKRLRFFKGATPEGWLTVVGVVSNIVQNDDNRQQFGPLVYVPYRQKTIAAMWVLARTRVPPASVGNVLRREVRGLDADLPIWGPVGLAEELERYWDSRFYGVVFLIFAAIALFLASIGLYTVMDHSVRQRTGEIGIRAAMGATADDILRLVFRQGMLPLAAGLVIGIAASFAVNRILKGMLVQVSPSDPVTLVVASAVLILAAMLGCWIPARRALHVDPVVALRHG